MMSLVEPTHTTHNNDINVRKKTITYLYTNICLFVIKYVYFNLGKISFTINVQVFYFLFFVFG